MSEKELNEIFIFIALKFYGIELLLQSILIRLYGEDNIDKITDVANAEIAKREKELRDKNAE